jgi:hypothetical protein
MSFETQIIAISVHSLCDKYLPPSIAFDNLLASHNRINHYQD